LRRWNESPLTQAIPDQDSQCGAQAAVIHCGKLLDARQNRAAAVASESRTANSGVIDLNDGQSRRSAVPCANCFVDKYARGFGARSVFLSCNTLNFVPC
jgi:hypothetical protein